MKVVAILETMWDWRSMTSGAGYQQAPIYFRINPENHSGRRLYRLVGSDADLWVTNACPQLATHAKQHGTPDPRYLCDNLHSLEPHGLILVCGKVAQETYRRSTYCTTAHVLEIPHPAARRWTRQMIEETSLSISKLIS